MSDTAGSTATPPPGTEPLGNQPEARTTDGTIKDQTQNQPSGETTEPEKKPDTKVDGEKKDEPKVGAPEKYEPFTAPEGKELSPELVTQAEATFKELNLTQEQGQKLVDLWNAQTAGLSDKLDQMVADQRKDWRDTIAKDKTLGNGTDNLSDASKKAVNDAISASGDAKVQTALKAALDLTGAGDHPDIVRAFVALGKLVGEATLVKGGGPAKTGQTQPGSGGRSAAQALYPNLPSSANG
jgi:hypothetical protein